MGPYELLQRIVEILDRLDIPYLVTGSVAAMAYGEPRLTNDIDIVAAVEERHVPGLLAGFPPEEFYVSEEIVREAIRRRLQFNIIHPSSGLKVDIMVRKDTPFDRSRFNRIRRIRPAESYLLYVQMIGRGTRPHPGKTDVTVVDIVDNSIKHRLVTLPSMFGLAEKFNLKGRTTAEVERAIRWVERNRPWVRADLAVALDDLRLRCRRVDLMELHLPHELRGADFAWVAIGRNTYRLGLGRGEYLTCSATLLDRWKVAVRSPDPEADGSIVAAESRLENAISRAEDFIRQTRPHALRLVDLGASWRWQPATEKQIERIRCAHLIPAPGISRGQASHLIAMLPR